MPRKARRPPMPASFDRARLETAGFTGWQTWAELRTSAYADVPVASAVYVVHRPSDAPPRFRKVNPGGHFKGQDPTVAPSTLRAKWMDGAQVIYIGKADSAQAR